MAPSTSLDLNCQLCGSAERDLVYERDFESIVLGRVRVALALCRCGFLYATPRPTRERLDEHYRLSLSTSGALWRDRGEGTRAATSLRRRVEFVRRLLAEASVEGPGAVLDVGASSGDLLLALELNGWELYGLEPSQRAARHARKRGLEIQNRALETHDLPHGSHDLVTAFGVLEHVWDVEVAMQALEDLVTPDGLLVLEVPDSTRPVSSVSEFYALEHLSHFSRGTLLTLARKHGFVPLLVEESLESGLRAGFRQVGREVAARHPVTDDRDVLARAVANYRAERAAFEDGLRARFEELAADWRESGRRVAVYGAGEHTHFLLDLVGLDDLIVGILDSDPSRHGRPFRRWKVYSPVEAPIIGADTVIVSSKPFQEEMVRALAPLVEGHGLEVVRCYPELEAPEPSAAA